MNLLRLLLFITLSSMFILSACTKDETNQTDNPDNPTEPTPDPDPDPDPDPSINDLFVVNISSLANGVKAIEMVISSSEDNSVLKHVVFEGEGSYEFPEFDNTTNTVTFVSKDLYWGSAMLTSFTDVKARKWDIDIKKSSIAGLAQFEVKHTAGATKTSTISPVSSYNKYFYSMGESVISDVMEISHLGQDNKFGVFVKTNNSDYSYCKGKLLTNLDFEYETTNHYTIEPDQDMTPHQTTSNIPFTNCSLTTWEDQYTYYNIDEEYYFDPTQSYSLYTHDSFNLGVYKLYFQNETQFAQAYSSDLLDEYHFEKVTIDGECDPSSNSMINVITEGNSQMTRGFFTFPGSQNQVYWSVYAPSSYETISLPAIPDVVISECSINYDEVDRLYLEAISYNEIEGYQTAVNFMMNNSLEFPPYQGRISVIKSLKSNKKIPSEIARLIREEIVY